MSINLFLLYEDGWVLGNWFDNFSFLYKKKVYAVFTCSIYDDLLAQQLACS